MSRESGLILVRHGEVAARYRGLCYGQADVELSPRGHQQHRLLVETLSKQPVTRIVHSGLGRTRLLAESLGARCAVDPAAAPALRERGYGTWELVRWDQIFAEQGDQMLRMLSEPEAYRPGGGETTFELRDRVVNWLAALDGDGLTVAVTHGGPIAALRGTLKSWPVASWPKLIPPYGEMTVIRRGGIQPPGTSIAARGPDGPTWQS